MQLKSSSMIVALPYRYRWLWLAIGWGMVAGVFILSLIPLEVDLAEGRDKVSHFIAYGTLMFWFGMLYLPARQPLALAIALAGMGIGIEFLQKLTGYRSFDVADMLANAIGVAIGWAVVRTPLRQLLYWVEATTVKRQGNGT